jgi:ribonuclease R
MEELQTNLLEYLNEQKRNVTIEELSEKFKGNYENDDILTAIVMLEKQGKIFRNKKNQFQTWHNGIGRIYGTIHITSRGAGIFKDEEGNAIFIHREFLNGAINGDKVIVRELKMVRDRQEGKIEKILDRTQHNVVCEVTSFGGVRKLKPLIENEDLKIKVTQQELKQYYEGDLLLLNVDTERDDEYFVGTIVKRLCHKDDPKSDIITIAATHGFDFDFPDEVKEEVKLIPQDISNEDISNREDLRNKVIFTIDGEDTKDIDDALSLEVLPNGNYKLGVHIADVSHYVKTGTALFNEALKRGTSVYMLNTVIPMLPRELSNGICSLNPEEDRLAKSCEMEIDRNGNIISSRIFDSVIRSRKKMSYTAVNKILEEGIIPEGYEEYAECLLQMFALSSKLEEKKKLRGAIDFDKPEIKIMTDYKGRVYDIKTLTQKSGEKLIENFMLAANESVSTTISKRMLPCIYRIHDMPAEFIVDRIMETICLNEEDITKPTSNFSSSKVIQSFLNAIREKDGYVAYSNMMLRGMSKAIYSASNVGHHGLALQYYSHFTSPIRRFPDLLLHTLINLYKTDEYKNMNLQELEKEIGEMAFQASEREREAQRAEFDANDMKGAEYLEDHIGEEYQGIITDITERGMTVMLDNLIEGYVNIADIEPKQFFKFYKARKMLASEEEMYCLGDRINMILKSANKKQKRINFIATGNTKIRSDEENPEKNKEKNKEKVKTKENKYRQK